MGRNLFWGCGILENYLIRFILFLDVRGIIVVIIVLISVVILWLYMSLL